MVRKIQSNSYEAGDLSAIGGNSLTFAYREFVNAAGGYAIKATTTGNVSGVSKEVATFASDNQTVAMKKLVYEPQQPHTTFRVPITGGTITIADEGQYFNLATSTTVNGASKSATTGQLKLVKFISATLCDFQIVNK